MRDKTINKLILLGAGGHARVIAEALRVSGKEILGLAIPGGHPGRSCFGVKVLGDDNVVLQHYSPDDVELVNGLGALPGSELRWQIGRQMKKQGYRFYTVIHPSAVVADGVVLEEGVQIMAGAVIQPGTKIGENSIVNTGCLIDHDCSIGVDCHLAPGVVLSGGVEIENRAHVGTGTCIIQNCKVGHGAIVGAGSVVYKDIPEQVKYIQVRDERIEKIGEL